MSSSLQLSFSLRVSSGVKTVHLLGSWDGYTGQLPLSKEKGSTKTWKGTFRFNNSTLEAGQRYWYYYIIDGYHVAHNPSEASTKEPTTGRELNILDVAGDKKKSSSHSSSKSKSSSRSSKEKSSKRSSTADIPKGRPLSVSQIKAPKPVAPHATRHILDEDYEVDELSDQFANTGIYEYDEDIITDFGASSPVSSTGSSLSYRSDSSSPSSSLSGYSTPGSDCSSCTCERYGITRKGERVRLDCGGSRCGYDEDSCSSSEDEEYVNRSARRNGIVVRS
ncbi:uncharacterized protein E0L32_000011 [Thyridium curvatum]|uniref:GTP-binding protein EsdC n=1 Tax=Thyridium curvatum TaxID=1093900 RepID=A0A507B7B1_9PEZI|nr:uncharacterized protein E0L32_000011 [Thyridium curvatum]TPX15677.1 hypothetical protein E0L32_000011 [Thyridium curvatum]